MRGATGITLQPHQMLCLPRKMTCINDWSSWHMKRHLQCGEQQASPSNLTKCCACHAKLHSKIKEKFAENNWSVNSNARPIRAWSEHDPNMIRAWTRHLAPARSLRLLFALRRRILYWKLQHFALRLSTQIAPNTVPATKSDTPTSPNAAPATKSDNPTSPNTAPATQNDSHDWCPSHLKRHLQCAEQQTSNDKFTKYCACHAKWISWLIRFAYETSYLASTVSFQPHQILRLPRNL